KPLDIEATVDLDEVVVCPPIVQEVLQGMRETSAFRMAKQSMLAFPIVESPMRIDVWLEAAELYRTARGAGITIRSSTDCLIAVCALRHDLQVLHRDRDYDRIASVTPLRVRSTP
ncbi:MAG: PIN domain-containing protein, partial [Planctomycetota bacterium]